MKSPQEAGDPLESTLNNNIWLNVTSIVESGSARNITAKINDTVGRN